eukprot:GDKI01028076.1.p1 GENE.GDKI01028076.1~~GDKI01028076.1.p1  ORF type:complete len:460 (+),score=120.97 GDKI01028076.1:730-2109(+)
MRLSAIIAACLAVACVKAEPYVSTEIDASGNMKTAAGVDPNDEMTSFISVEEVINKYVPEKERKNIMRVINGRGSEPKTVPSNAQQVADANNFQIKLESMVHLAAEEQLRSRRVVRIAVAQNSIAKPTTDPIKDQFEGILAKIEKIIDAAGMMGVNVLALQEAWTMPFAFCTREKLGWMEFAEDPENGLSTKFIKKKAKQWNMVIVSPILERDMKHQERIWNTAVVIGNRGNYIGKHRKNHIPRVGDFNEASYYLEGDTGHPVFETEFGRIAINICYGRHHPLNWMGFALNGAEIVFNPSATVGALSEPMWAIEGRNAAIANTYFVASTNRVGTETFPNEFTSADGKPAHKDFGHFYGSAYVAGPDSSRSTGLSRVRDGLLAVDVDLNQIRQVRDRWMYQMTARYEMYAALLNDYVRHDFKPQIIRDPAMEDRQDPPESRTVPLSSYRSTEGRHKRVEL